MQIPVTVRSRPSAEFRFRLGERVAVPLRAFAASIDIEWVVGAAGWVLLVIVIVQSGRLV